jgi:hypothetical protein
MKTDPFTDSFWFLLGQTGYDEPLSWGRWVMVALLLILLTDSVAIARANWSADPAQRTAGDLWTLLFRVLLGAMCSRVRCGSCLCRMQEACNTGPGRWQNMPRSRSTGEGEVVHIVADRVCTISPTRWPAWATATPRFRCHTGEGTNSTMAAPATIHAI